MPYVWNDEHPMRIGLRCRAPVAVHAGSRSPRCTTAHAQRLRPGRHGRGGVHRVPRAFSTRPAAVPAASATGAPTLDRWMIDLRTGRVRSSRLDDRPQEFPRINESLVSRRHRYAYTASAAEMWRAYGTVDGAPPDEKFSNYLMKHDMPRGRGRSTALPGRGGRRGGVRPAARGAGRGRRLRAVVRERPSTAGRPT